jgi:hypothetical protein
MRYTLHVPIVMLDGVGESGDKACMHMMRDIGWTTDPAAAMRAAGAAAYPVVVTARLARVRCWRILKARDTVPLRVREEYGAA